MYRFELINHTLMHAYLDVSIVIGNFIKINKTKVFVT